MAQGHDDRTGRAAPRGRVDALGTSDAVDAHDAVPTGPVPVGPPLHVLREARVRDLLGAAAGDHHRFEASGLTLRAGRLLLICDNLADLVEADPALAPGTARYVPNPGPAPGYEDVAHDPVTDRTFVLVEAATTRDGLRPEIDELDADLRHVARRPVEVPVDGPNKGLEGLACVRRDGSGYLLALAEAPDAATGRGVVHVLVEESGAWAPVARFLLPALGFADHSGISLADDGRLAVVSQQSSALWVGRLADDAWAVADAGVLTPFPRDETGRTLYGTVEGICWLGPTTLAAVSDKAKPEDPERFRRTHESVHVVALPG